MKNTCKQCRNVLIVSMVAFGAFTTPAQDINYNSPGSTNFIGTAVSGTRLIVGDTEADVSLFVTNGGLVEISLQAAIGNESDANNNLLQVEDGGIVLIGNTTTNGLSSTAAIVVGDTDGNGELLVDYGSETVTTDMYVGRLSDESGSVTLANGGQLSISGILTVGAADNADNLITIANGGKLAVEHETNIVINTGTNDSNKITVNSGGAILVRGDVNATTITERTNLTFRAGAILGTGGELTIDNNAIENSLNILLDSALSTNTAQWNADAFYVGEKTSNNSLTLTNGALASATGSVYIGDEASARGNSLQVSGEGSTVTIGANLFVGKKGNNNRLIINDGGQMEIGQDLILGSSSIGNRYLHTDGTNSVAGRFIIGRTKDAAGKTIPNNIDTSGNLGSVGADAVLEIGQELIVGQEGGGSILLINDGGTINVAGNAVIGEASGDNYIFLQPDDPDSQLTIAGHLLVGNNEDGDNRFAVYGGTADIGGDLYLGNSTNQHLKKNYIHLETTNAALHVANAIYIGASNSVNTLDLVAGATVTAQDLWVGTYEGVSNNAVTVTGENSLLSISNTVAIGSGTGTNNSVTVKEGGTLSVSAQSNIQIAENNTLTIKDEGILKTLGWDFSTAMTNLIFESGSTLHLLGAVTGTNKLDGGLNLVLDGELSGTNAVWNTGTNALYIGFNSPDNSLTVTNGALATTSSNLYIGTPENEGTWPNHLNVMEGGVVDIGGDAYLGYASFLKIDSKSQLRVAGSYEQSQFAILEVGVSSNQVQPNLVVGENAEFTTSVNTTNYPILKVFDDGIEASNVVRIVQAKTITIDGEEATASLLRSNIDTNLLLGFDISISNTTDNSFIVLDNFIKHSIGNSAGLEGQLLAVANEIDGLTNDLTTVMRNILGDMASAEEQKTAFDNYYGERRSSAPAHNAINLGLQSVAEQLTQRADSTRARMGAATASINPHKPAGVAGPHIADQELQGWIGSFSTRGDRSESDGFNGYDADIGGFVAGVDFSVGENLLLGFAGGNGKSSIDQDNAAKTDTQTSFGSLYISAGTTSWFADAGFIYGGSSIDSTLGSTFDTTADFDAANYAFFFGGGKEFAGDYLILTPHASLLCNYYTQDRYTEQSSNAIGREVDEFDTLYIQSSLGLNVGMYLAMGDLILKPEVRFAWQHEFNAEEEQLNYALIGGTGTHNLVLQAPEEDILKVGIGASTKLGEFLELRADLDTRRSGDYSDYTLLGSLRYQF